MRDHGGDPDRARREYGEGDWLDLSTGINPRPYPIPAIPARAFTDLPTGADLEALIQAARQAYATEAGIVPLGGAQAAIQIVPRLAEPGRARVLAPTYNEHGAALAAQGWPVQEVRDPEALAGADLAVLVNPNNPDGRRHDPDWLGGLAGRVGLLIVDESFADAEPGLSLAPRLPRLENVVVLRSFGKFYGLAGLRLGFALAAPGLSQRIAALAGPWAVSGPAIHAGIAALRDRDWRLRRAAGLAWDADRLDRAARLAGWRLVGGTELFRTYDSPDAHAAQDRLARARIWTRIFPYSAHWIRLGLPGDETGWHRLERALTGQRD
ncbi:threonine-phosphate decarboxylase CobD [Paracoccus ravus]|uniref:threonine-phosphate decarboxylase CobD n=1 Tax=Paracoccus ravus TaxID=2447760 RepID=UPI00106E52C9|nr:threonine-phosphate decarboxylase CobD [Paracoccus ravus]